MNYDNSNFNENSIDARSIKKFQNLVTYYEVISFIKRYNIVIQKQICELIRSSKNIEYT